MRFAKQKEKHGVSRETVEMKASNRMLFYFLLSFVIKCERRLPDFRSQNSRAKCFSSARTTKERELNSPMGKKTNNVTLLYRSDFCFSVDLDISLFYDIAIEQVDKRVRLLSSLDAFQSLADSDAE